MTLPEWDQYAINVKNREAFSIVKHVAHLETAYRIFADYTINAGLIYDESQLNTRRLLVSWFSPNDWDEGYRYGNVAFNCDFHTLVEGKRFYWVEVMDYKPHACRILITDRDYAGDGVLKIYDPTIDNGPFKYDSAVGQYYRNKNICLEFMLEADVALGEVKKVDFVHHHPNYCCIKGGICRDFDKNSDHACLAFLSHVLANDLVVKGGWFVENNGENIAPKSISPAVSEISNIIDSKSMIYTGSLPADKEIKKLIFKGCLIQLQVGLSGRPHFRKAISVFENAEEVTGLFKELVTERFGINDFN